MSRFLTPVGEGFTRTVPLGPCECPDTPHAEGDTAEVYRVLGWDDLFDVGEATQRSAGAGMRVLVTRALASWTLEERNGDGKNHPVPIIEATVRLLNEPTIEAIVEAANEAYEAAKAPVPKGSGKASRASSGGTHSTRTRTAKPTR